MSLCILPPTDIFPAFDDDFFDVIEDIEEDLENNEEDLADIEEHPTNMEEDLDFPHINELVESMPVCPLEAEENESKLILSLDVSQYKPEDLNINLEGRTLTIEGKQEIEENDAHSLSFNSFIHQWELPEDVDVDQIRSSLTEDGQLAVEVPKVAGKTATGRNIPIQKAVAEK